MGEKPKIYLDTNIILDWFKYNVKNIRENKPLHTTSKLKFLVSRDHRLFVSYLTRAEIFRYLKSEWDASPDDCLKYWETFLPTFGIEEIRVKKFLLNLEEVSEICSRSHLPKKIFADLIHIQLAKAKAMTFLSGDQILEERLQWYYPRIISYLTLRSKFS